MKTLSPNIIAVTMLLSFGLFQNSFAQWNSSGMDWNIIQSPSPRSNNKLNGVVAISTDDAWAVGTYEEINVTPIQPLTLHWNGTVWTHVPAPVPYAGGHGELNAVSAVSTNDVWAVGFFYPGTAGQTMIMHWQEDSGWTIVPSANREGYNELKGVTAISASNVWAVGYSPGLHATLVEHWDGIEWSIVASPPISFSSDYIMEGVAAVSADDIWAVGYIDRGSGTRSTLIEHWDGISWTIVPSPNPGEYVSTLSSVTTVSTNDVWAAGWYSNDGGATYLTLTEHWTGTSWSVVESPNESSDFNELIQVKALSANNIWAVGLYNPGLFTEFVTLIEHWNGTEWSIVPSPNAGSRGNALYSVSALPSGEAWAVGSSFTVYNPFIPSQTLVERHLPAAVNIKTETGKVSDFHLLQNYPNPFNPETKIKFEIFKDGIYSLEVYDWLGRKVNTLSEGFKNTGTYEINFNAENLSTGIYFYRLVSDYLSLTKKMLLVK